MPKALFIHGTDGDPSHHWWPWLKNEFENSGYEVWAPLMPDNHRPNYVTYKDFLLSKDWDFEDSVLVGHSSGATTVLNILADEDFPVVRASILAGVFLNENLTAKLEDFKEVNQFKELFPKNGFDWDKIKSQSKEFYFVHGDNDPYCSFADTVTACKSVSGTLITIPSGGHLSTSFGVTKLPELVEELKSTSVLK